MTKRLINVNGKLVDLTKPVVMGILNVTPDSFYSGSRIEAEHDILARCQTILNEGGRIIDVGAQSSNPKSNLLTAAEEASRLMPALKLIRREYPEAVLSVDTFYADVAKQAVEEYGVDVINDISGGQIDDGMFETMGHLRVPYILMHMRGTPQTMQSLTHYDNFIQELLTYFAEKKAQLYALGVNDIIIDPGFGFSKTLEQNYELMAHLSAFSLLDAPMLVGISRKSMLYKLFGTTPEESLNGTTVLNTYALMNGASILRVHDVREAVEAIEIVEKITSTHE